MRLTTQMKAELKNIDEYLERTKPYPMFSMNLHLNKDGSLAPTSGIKDAGYSDWIWPEMKTYKLRLDNLLCETDLKEQDHFRVSIF